MIVQQSRAQQISSESGDHRATLGRSRLRDKDLRQVVHLTGNAWRLREAWGSEAGQGKQPVRVRYQAGSCKGSWSSIPLQSSGNQYRMHQVIPAGVDDFWEGRVLC